MTLTRREVLGGAFAAGAALALPRVAGAAADDDGRAALVAALRLEQTALVAYEAIANAGVLTGALRLFLEHERQHAGELEAALESLGADPPIPPRRTDIRGLEAAQRSRDAALPFAIALESRTIAAYQRVVRDAADPNVIRTSAGAMGTDAQQLAVLRELAGVPAVPRALETGRR